MKIVHFAYFGRFGKVTGIGESVMNLVVCQKELGNNVRIYIPFDHPYVDNITVFFIKSLSFVLKEIKLFRPDIVVFDGMYDKYQIRLAYYLKLKSIPYVLVFHGGASADNAKKHKLKKKIANYFLFNRFVKFAQKVVYLSEAEKNKSIFTRQNSNYCIIPNGVNCPEEVGFQKNRRLLKIAFLSRLDWYGKGLDVLCDAMKILYTKGYESKLEFNFYGPKESNLCDNLFVFGKMSNYRGYVMGEEKKEAFIDTDIFILTSRSEGMPMSVLEALSYGVPCIVTPETNMASLIKDNHCGWVVDLSAQDISNVIIKIEKEYRIAGETYYSNCISTAKHFDWKLIAKQTIEVYNQVINNV